MTTKSARYILCLDVLIWRGWHPFSHISVALLSFCLCASIFRCIYRADIGLALDSRANAGSLTRIVIIADSLIADDVLSICLVALYMYCLDMSPWPH